MVNTSYYKEQAEKHFGHDRGEKTVEEWENSKVEVSERDLSTLADGLFHACEQIEYLKKEMARLQEHLLHADTVESRTQGLELHYKCVVRPVTEYCEAFYDWLKALEVAHKEWDEKPEESKQWHSPPPLYNSKEHIGFVLMAIGKSDYLRRRIYAKEPHRTEKCPVHQGKWSGIRWPTEPPMEGCLCQDPDGNVSGWIPVE